MRIKIPLKLVHLEEGNYHLIAEGRFENRDIINWVVDTGASKSVFDKNLTERYEQLKDETEEIQSAGIGENKLKTGLGILETFWFGKLNIEHAKMAIIDLSHVNKLYSNVAKIQICGLLGGDFLLKYKAKIDYKKNVLELTTTK
jgi:hypothetical protein